MGCRSDAIGGAFTVPKGQPSQGNRQLCLSLNVGEPRPAIKHVVNRLRSISLHLRAFASSAEICVKTCLLADLRVRTVIA